MHRSVVLIALVAMVTSACSASTGSETTAALEPPSAPTTATTIPEPTLEWWECGNAQCATLTVPLDYDDPALGTIDLDVTRLPATGDRIGALLYNPGGPGLPGVPLWRPGFSPDLRERFDIVSWNPRGVGGGAFSECDIAVGDLDPSPDTPAEQALVDERLAEAVACFARHDLLPHVSTLSTVRDMDLLRAALGEVSISYLGQSYGTAIGSIYATLYPGRVRAMVLDGAYDITEDAAGGAVRQALVMEATVEEFLDQCGENRFCELNRDGDPHAVFDELVATLDDAPIGEGREAFGLTALGDALFFGLWREENWSNLSTALAYAADGKPRRLLAVAPPFPNSGANLAINCLDHPRGVMGSVTSALGAVDLPHTGGLHWTWDACESWPVPPDLPPPVTGAGAGPILVIATTGDMATPFEAGRVLAERLDEGALLVVERHAHTAYQPGFFDTRCVTEVVDSYLIDLVVPPSGAVCTHGEPNLKPPA